LVAGENSTLKSFGVLRELAFWRGKRHTASMMGRTIALLLSALAFLSPPIVRESGALDNAPEFANGELKLPQGYREWVYLTSGFDMSYNPAMQMANHHIFDNVFVNPEAYKAFVNTGTWPDKTILVLEVRGAQGKGSINQNGNFQDADVMGIELHVKDEARFPGKWAFFAFDGVKTAKTIPTTADCYSCHSRHAAVDTTFVQFYPTLLPIAQEKRTLSTSYLQETAAPSNR
jgi:hypothetical protein